MAALVRLRSLQCEQSERLHAQRLKALQQSEATLRTQQRDYEQISECYQGQQSTGLLVDPALHEHRRLGLLVMRARLCEQKTRVAKDRGHVQMAKQALNASRVAERVADKSYQNAKDVLYQALIKRELIDSFDAQQAGACPHGI